MNFLRKKNILVLLLIIVIGVFLRTYHFHDWLRFNADQGRDAILVSSVIENKEAWPLLGPKAGGTDFKLGPVFYYFEIISAKIFGNYPDKMAYPDLFTSILCIPLLFFFLCKYFNIKIATALSAIFAISLYAIQYSRFSWNPNSIPFWSILSLYALHEIIAKKTNNKLAWSIIAGMAIGISVQLHTTLLLFLPITTIILFGFLSIKKRFLLKYFFIILVVSLFFNIPQIINEYKTDGKNIQAFFNGMEKKQEDSNSLVDKIFHNTNCLIQGNINIISSYEISNECKLKATDSGNIVIFIFGLIFMLGGIGFGLHYFRQEKDFNRKAFLGINLLYTAIAYILLIPISYEISMRFYLALIFMPFLLLGLWLQFLSEKLPKKLALYTIIAIFSIFAISNIYFVQKYFAEFIKYDKGLVMGGKIDSVTLKEVEGISKFIIDNSNGALKVYIDGNQQYLFKAIKPIEFLVSRSNIEIESVRKNDEKKFPLFTIDSLKSKKNDAATFGRFSIWVENN